MRKGFEHAGRNASRIGRQLHFLLLDDAAPEAAVVDPGDAEPVLRYLEEAGRRA